MKKYKTLHEEVWDQTKTSDERKETHARQVGDQQAAIQNDPSLGTLMSNEEMQSRYASLWDSSPDSRGGYTKSESEAEAARAAGATVTAADKPGTEESGWYHYTGYRQEDPTNGGSGADRDLMTNEDYAAVQFEKARYADAQAKYQEALAAGRAEEAAQYKAIMDEAHSNAERIRLRYDYQGGADGSLYLTAGELGLTPRRDPSRVVKGTDAMRAEAAGVNGIGYAGAGTAGGTTWAGRAAAAGQGAAASGAFGAAGGIGTAEDYIRQMYGAQQDAAVAELEAAYKKSLAELDNAEAGLAESYQTARNEAAGASELAGRNFNEFAAAYGLNTGTGGQAELSRNIALQGQLGALDQEEANAFADLELARANAAADYELAISQAISSGNYELAYALYQEQIRQQELAAQEQALARDEANAAKSQLAAYGEYYLQSGVMPSAEMLAAMGITAADAESFIKSMQLAAAAKTYTGGGSNSETPSVWSAISNMTNRNEVSRYLLDNGLSKEREDWLAEWDAYQRERGTDSFTTWSNTIEAVKDLIQRDVADGASPATIFGDIMSSNLTAQEKIDLAIKYGVGSPENIWYIIDSHGLTASQKEQLMTKYGLS